MSAPSAKLLRNDILAEARATAAIAPTCRHAPPNDRCGGCALQDRPYAAQVAAKQAALQRLWMAVLPPGTQQPGEYRASPDPLHYRTRMDYVASRGRFGLRRGGKFNWIIDLAECHLIPPAAFAVARAVYEQAMALGLPDYDLRAHQGFLRYITVRRSPDNQLLLVAVTKTTEHAAEMAALAGFALEQPGVLGLHWLHNPGVADMANGELVRYWGTATLPMQVGQRTLQIGPRTFFQNNIHLLLPLLDDLRASVCATAAAGGALQVADLYGGVGTIALHLADAVGQVVCVESVAESVELAHTNVAANQVTNVQPVLSEVAPFLAASERFDVVVADPPRTGLGEAVCAELVRLRPARIVYLSCNPLTQVDDARLLAPAYQLVALRGYDMFPQTAHLESLGIFDLVQ